MRRQLECHVTGYETHASRSTPLESCVCASGGPELGRDGEGVVGKSGVSVDLGSDLPSQITNYSHVTPIKGTASADI